MRNYNLINMICFPLVLLHRIAADEQVLIRLIGADEHMSTNHMDSMKWLEDTDVLEMIVDKFSSSVSCIICLNELPEHFAFTLWAVYIVRGC